MSGPTLLDKFAFVVFLGVGIILVLSGVRLAIEGTTTEGVILLGLGGIMAILSLIEVEMAIIVRSLK